MASLRVGIAISFLGLAFEACGTASTQPSGQQGSGASSANVATDAGALGSSAGVASSGSLGGSGEGSLSGGNASTSLEAGSSGAGSSGSSGASAPGDGGATDAGETGGQDGSSVSDGSAGPSTPQELILYDDSNGRLLYVNNANPAANWISNTGMGRDVQLVGGGRVMLGKFDGWDEYRLTDGVNVAGQHGFPGTLDSYRLTDGNTMLASLSGTSIVLKMVNASGAVQSQITYSGFSFVGMVRPTSTGTYLVGADTVVFEGNDQGTIVWRVNPDGGRHAWKAMRLANGNTVISTGYGASLVVYDSAGKLLQTIGGPNQPNAAQIAPWFYADFHVMPNATYFVVNSQADRTMDSSIQLLEYDTSGTLVWQQKQPMGVRTLEEAIVLDGLDTSKLNVEPQGVMVPFP